ncbi:MAG: endolytic transglycosylase MltG [Deltaproteobacteria bacterium]|nr:endolytic transglycosylase MltG [Deltaproteobacteria bacterium]
MSSLVFVNFACQPVGQSSKTILIDIPRGTGFMEITGMLDNAGLVENKPFFYTLAIMKGAVRQIRAGEYELSYTMSPIDIINKLVKGDIKAYLVTIPEDFTVKEIAARLAANKLVPEKTFLKLAFDHNFVKTLNIPGKTLEGYLYPETYKLDRSMGSKEIIQIMNQQFWRRFTPDMRQRAAAMGMTITEVVTLASIIGKETGFKDEKPLVSAVFHNRLKKGMKLQSDPTAVYNLDDFDGKIRKSHLLRDTSHNTYRNKGLPPGPIANPDIDSLTAALYPARVDYLYFVANNNGSHQFSLTLIDHHQAVSKYQTLRKK